MEGSSQGAASAETGGYSVATMRGVPVTAIGPLPESFGDTGRSVWTTYFAVDDIAAASAAAGASGTVLLPPGELAPGVQLGIVADPAKVKAINHDGKLKMPKKKLPAEQIAALTQWIKMGAPWPDGDKPGPTRKAEFQITEKDYRGLLFIEPARLRVVVEEAARRRWQVTAHTSGEGAMDVLLDAYENVDRLVPIKGR